MDKNRLLQVHCLRVIDVIAASGEISRSDLLTKSRLRAEELTVAMRELFRHQAIRLHKAPKRYGQRGIEPLYYSINGQQAAILAQELEVELRAYMAEKLEADLAIEEGSHDTSAESH